MTYEPGEILKDAHFSTKYLDGDLKSFIHVTSEGFVVYEIRDITYEKESFLKVMPKKLYRLLCDFYKWKVKW